MATFLLPLHFCSVAFWLGDFYQRAPTAAYIEGEVTDISADKERDTKLFFRACKGQKTWISTKPLPFSLRQHKKTFLTILPIK